MPKLKQFKLFSIWKYIVHKCFITVIKLQNDEKLLALWLQLFNSPKECICEQDTASEVSENGMNFNDKLLQYELEQC